MLIWAQNAYIVSSVSWIHNLRTNALVSMQFNQKIWPIQSTYTHCYWRNSPTCNTNVRRSCVRKHNVVIAEIQVRNIKKNQPNSIHLQDEQIWKKSTAEKNRSGKKRNEWREGKKRIEEATAAAATIITQQQQQHKNQQHRNKLASAMPVVAMENVCT